MSKKLALIFCLTLLFIALPVSAREATAPGMLREKIMEKKEQMIEKRTELKEKVQIFKNTRASLKQAKLLTKSDNTLTVEKDSVVYTINFTDKTQFRRRFWGKSNFSELTIGDLLDIQGKWANDAKTIINATLIRDTSIQMRFGTFFGSVTSISGNTIVIESEKRESQTITTSSSSKIINRKEQKINLSDILVGHKIRVKGLYNNTANTITEVKEIKDFSLPIRTEAQ